MKIAMMIDLETLSTSVNAVVVSGGYVVIDREAPAYTELRAHQSKLTFNNQIIQHRAIEESTIRWHIEHPTDTFKGATPITDIYMLLQNIEAVVSSFNVEEVWSKGANFDIAILESASHGKAPWNYKLPRCFRTLQALYPDCSEKNPLAHNALEDARDQAKELWRITQKYLLPQH